MKWFVSILLVTLFAPLTFAQKKLLIDVKGTSLQELMNLKITSLSKKSEPLSEAPAAVYVLTRDDIIRSGANHLPEVLRYVPGVEVARISATQWAISIRGFNSNSANKLLVMIDGRSVYSPLYSGVLWEEKDVLMDDVERIEVVRGPGGTLWGANAVNGVINIITRSARDAEGSHIKVGAGRVEKGIVQLRHEQAVTDHQFVRVYGKFTDREESPAAQNDSDKGQLAMGGFRWDIVDQFWGNLTVQGDVYHSELGGGFVSATREGRDGRGHNLLLNWKLKANPRQNHKLLFYFDHTTLETSLSDRRDIWNLEYQLQQQWGRNEFVIGAGYRYLTDDVTGSDLFSVAPQKRSDEIINVFLQNDTAFQGNTLHLILGSKFEHNNYTGDEWQPSIRLAKIWGDFMVWGAWSRAIRVPSRLEHDIVSPFLTGNQTAVSEESDFYEIGMRYQHHTQWQTDLSLYYGEYEHLLSVEIPMLANNISGRNLGLELSSQVQLLNNWLLRLNYTYTRLLMETAAGSLDTSTEANIEGRSPRHMAQLISFLDLSPQWQLNSYIRFFDELAAEQTDHYVVFDLALSWQLHPAGRLQLVGRHLGDAKHREWSSPESQVEQEVMLMTSWSF